MSRVKNGLSFCGRCPQNFSLMKFQVNEYAYVKYCESYLSVGMNICLRQFLIISRFRLNPRFSVHILGWILSASLLVYISLAHLNREFKYFFTCVLETQRFNAH